jgi:capsular polysaccharide export protein
MNRGALGVEFDGPLYAHGFSWRKRRYLRAFTARPDLRFVRRGEAVGRGAHLLLWGSAAPPRGLDAAARIVRVEDGFLRSVGLGADLTRPVSWVFDDLGIYYDAAGTSALERMLQEAEFPAGELARAAALRKRIVQAGLTKYNLAPGRWERPAHARTVVLVPGQVETDASIRQGCHDVRTNLGLLQAVRRARPDAWVVYKPHPDVVAGLRNAGVGDEGAGAFCDETVVGGSMHDLLQRVDEVHAMTSLAGFEALLRGVPVVCWGHPFYAGWGLTQDTKPHPTRTRRLGLDELVAGALLRYPVYLSPRSGIRCTPEEGLEALLQWRERAPAQDAWWRRFVRPLIGRP